MILDIYTGCFNIIYIWSPPIDVDSTWKPVKDYIRDHIKPNDREKCYFDSYDPSELEQVVKTQQQVIDYQKRQTHKDLYQRLIVVDDFATSHLPHKFVHKTATQVVHESLKYYINYMLEVAIIRLAQLHQHKYINKYRQW